MAMAAVAAIPADNTTTLVCLGLQCLPKHQVDRRRNRNEASPLRSLVGIQGLESEATQQ